MALIVAVWLGLAWLRSCLVYFLIEWLGPGSEACVEAPGLTLVRQLCFLRCLLLFVSFAFSNAYSCSSALLSQMLTLVRQLCFLNPPPLFATLCFLNRLLAPRLASLASSSSSSSSFPLLSSHFAGHLRPRLVAHPGPRYVAVHVPIPAAAVASVVAASHLAQAAAWPGRDAVRAGQLRDGSAWRLYGCGIPGDRGGVQGRGRRGRRSSFVLRGAGIQKW